MTYQTLKGYEGNLYGAPQYSGLEYDSQVPDTNIIGSPGGSATTFHHYTKGYYGEGNSMSDIYAGMGYRYPYGEFGNMYQVGQSAPHQMGYYTTPPDKMFTENDRIPNPSFTSPTYRPSVGKNDSTVQEGFEMGTENYTSLADLPELKDPDRGIITHKIVLPNPLILFGLFIIAYVAMDFWALSGQYMMQDYFNSGKTFGWKWFLFYAILFSVVMIILASITNVPLITLEQL